MSSFAPRHHWHDSDPRQHSMTKELCGIVYTTDENGRIHLHEAETGKAIDVAKMDQRERLAFFSKIAATYQRRLPGDILIDRRNPNKIVFERLHTTGLIRRWTASLFRPDKLRGDGIIIGRLQNKTLVVEWIQSTIVGGGRVLLGELLKHHPEAECISGEMSNVNLIAYQQARFEGKSEDEALRATPAYKSCAAYGFTEFQHQRYEFIRGKPTLTATLHNTPPWPAPPKHIHRQQRGSATKQ